MWRNVFGGRKGPGGTGPSRAATEPDSRAAIRAALQAEARAIQPIVPPWADTVRGPPIDVIAVSRWAMDERKPIYVLEDVSNFVGLLIDRFGFELSQFADHTLALHQINVYIGQVNNGGHGQYAENTGLRGPTVRYCRQGLSLIGATDYLKRYDTVVELIERPDQVRNLFNGAFSATPEVEAFDKPFYADDKADSLSGYAKRFLMAQPWFHVVETAHFWGTLAWLARLRDGGWNDSASGDGSVSV